MQFGDVSELFVEAGADLFFEFSVFLSLGHLDVLLVIYEILLQLFDIQANLSHIIGVRLNDLCQADLQIIETHQVRGLLASLVISIFVN